MRARADTSAQQFGYIFAEYAGESAIAVPRR